MQPEQLSVHHRVVVVDDMPLKLRGHCGWLSDSGFRDVVPLNFHQALTYDRWGEAHTLVVDGMDEDKDSVREHWILKMDQDDPTFRDERYMGVRVVEAARQASRDLVITVVSSFVEKSPAMVERFYEVGANYIYSH
jgi:hypothetical protein